MSFLMDGVSIARYKVRNWLGRYPSLFFPAMSLFGSPASRARMLSRDTELVIEGFPRSANTFALVAFEAAQRRPVKLAHHEHVPAQIVRAVQHGQPVLSLIRKPEDAVLSLLVFAPWVPVTDALDSYYHFYARILPFASRFVTATFEQVTTDYGAVIRQINEKYGTDFELFEHTKENVNKCFQTIDQKERRRTGMQDVAAFAARPTEQKEKSKSPFRDAFQGKKEGLLLERCCQIYNETLSVSQPALQGDAAIA